MSSLEPNDNLRHLKTPCQTIIDIIIFIFPTIGIIFSILLENPWCFAVRHTQLRAFHAVACESSFSKAAEKLRLTQPALSVQVRALEQMYGVQLFDRTGPVVRLTSLGRSLFALTHKLHDIESDVQELLAGSQRLETGQLRLAAGGPYVVMGLIAEFARRYPNIEIVVSFGNTDQVWRELLERQADVVVLTGAPEDERAFAIPVAHQRIVVIMPRDHHLAKHGRIALRALEGEEVILREDHSYTQQIVDQVLTRAAVRVRPVLRLGSREAVHEAVAEGLGIGFVLDRETGQDNRLASALLSDTAAVGLDSVVCLKRQANRQVVRAFLDVARDVRETMETSREHARPAKSADDPRTTSHG